MNITEDKERLIARYLNGDCPPHEYQELIEWLQSSEENQQLFYRIKDTWDASLKEKESANEELIRFYKSRADSNQNASKRIYLWKWPAAVAAVLFIGLLITTIFKTDTTSDGMVSYNVPLGSRSELVLADGSHVHLNSGSTLSYPSVFDENARVVTLTGEAYFEVESDENHPFIVNTSDLEVKVTGTKFNVSTYDDNEYTAVSLVEGKVTLDVPGRKKEVVLKPGEKVSFYPNKRNIHMVSADWDTEIGWTKGVFSFKEVNFRELVKRLERWYDVELNYNSKELDSMIYKGTFKNEETIWQVLDALKLTTPIDYKKDGFRKFEIIYKPM